MSARSDVLLWATRIVNKGTTTPTQLLEIREGAGLDEAQAAFHKVARMAHPDLHRSSLSAEELELVTTAYSRVAGAYQELRTQRMQTTKLPRSIVRPTNAPPSKPAGSAPRADATPVNPEPPKSSGVGAAAAAMTPKALVYYRKAELALRRGDLKGAVLQLKMAIAADPLSTLLRSALAEVETELKGGG